ncbi:MAG: hypothetical protein ACRDTT_01905 [Pseudonocardiaceae bacterium]
MDATTYRPRIPEPVRTSKVRYFQVESIARRRRVGEQAPRGLRTFSAGLIRIGTMLVASGYQVQLLPLEDLG